MSWRLGDKEDYIGAGERLCDYVKANNYSRLGKFLANDTIAERINDRYGENNKTLLHIAAVYGHYDVAKVLIRHGIDINATDTLGRTALDIASANNNDSLCYLIISNNTAMHVTFDEIAGNVTQG